MGNELDLLVVRNCMLWKEAQDAALKVEARSTSGHGG
jgi:hypothetical protein